MMPAATPEIAALIALAAVAWLIWDSLKAREAAVEASRAACAAENVQFLDDTVAVESVCPARAPNGNLRLRRVYGFEYTATGNSRQRGTVVMLGDEGLVLRLDG